MRRDIHTGTKRGGLCILDSSLEETNRGCLPSGNKVGNPTSWSYLTHFEHRVKTLINSSILNFQRRGLYHGWSLFVVNYLSPKERLDPVTISDQLVRPMMVLMRRYSLRASCLKFAVARATGGGNCGCKGVGYRSSEATNCVTRMTVASRAKSCHRLYITFFGYCEMV
jgi:hypothetical protein